MLEDVNTGIAWVCRKVGGRAIKNESYSMCVCVRERERERERESNKNNYKSNCTDRDRMGVHESGWKSI